ncbi:MAG: hypothetical protein PHD81_04385 [Candidatus Nanoarchaeia archaeon]|nr:hypothetical protein [Candidatus Nanoarchaeia archaeon]MDD5588316.1 hypothetical protein [Candidatus Nanoarchaeia archaeon]
MKIFKYLLIFVLILLVLPIGYSAPKWKQNPSTPSTPTEPTTIIKETVIINNTSTPTEQEGIDWNMVGGIAAVIGIAAALAGWFFTRKKSGTTSKYLTEINTTFNNYKNNSDKCEIQLLELKNKLEKEFSSGKLTEQSYDILDRKIDNYLGDIRKGIVNQLQLTGEARQAVEKALKDGKISEKEYDTIKKLDLKGLAKEQKEKLFKLLKKWEEKSK